MLILWLCQALFGAVALALCLRAAISAVRGKRQTSYDLMIAGAVSLVFFLTIPNVRPELLAAALLATLVGAILLPSKESTPLLFDLDTTLTRRPRK